MVTRLTPQALPGPSVTAAQNTYEAEVSGIGLNGTISGGRVTLVTAASNTAYGYVTADTPAANWLNVLLWFDPNTVSLAGTVYLLSVLDSGSTEIARLEMRYSSGYQVRQLAMNTGGGGLVEVATWQAITDAEHYSRLVLTRAAAIPASDGTALWELDGTEVATKSNADAFTVNWGEIRIGLPGLSGAGQAGIYYVDNLSVGYTADPTAPPTPTPSVIATPTGRSKVLRIVRGFDPANPTDAIELNGTSRDFYLNRERSAIRPGELNFLTTGLRPDRDGERVVSESRSNARFQLAYNIRGDNVLDLGLLQTKLGQMLNNAANYEQKGQGEPVWIEYRWDDGLNIQPPVFGQLNHYLRIRRGWNTGWPDDIHRMIHTASVDGVVAEFICDPLPQGLERWAGLGSGGIDLHPWGLMSGLALDNFFKNPQFAHSTWSTGWTTGTNILATHSTDVYYSRESAALLTNVDSVSRTFWNTVSSLDAETYRVTFKAKSPVGTAITSSIVQVLGNNATQTTSYQAIDDGWYLGSGTFTLGTTTANVRIGCVVAAGQSVIVDDFVCHYDDSGLVLPFASGDTPGHYWSSTRSNSVSGAFVGGGRIDFTDFTNELTGVFTISGWLTPHWDSPWGSGSARTIFRYKPASDTFFLTFDPVNEVYELSKTVNATTYTDNTLASAGYTFGTPIHLTVVQTDTQMILYENGTALGTVDAPGTLAEDGLFSLCYGSSFYVALDGWRIWKQSLSASQVSQLYTAENVVKAAGGIIGMPAALAFGANTNSYELDNYTLPSTQENFVTLLGVNGSSPARLKFYLDSSDSIPSSVDYPTDILVARQALEEMIYPSALGAMNELGGTANAYSVNAAYQTTNIAAGLSAYVGAFTVNERLRGGYVLIGRYACGSTEVTIAPFFHYGADNAQDYALGKAITAHGSGTILRYTNFGALPDLKHPGEDKPPLTFGLKVVNNSTSSQDFLLDFLALVPAPFIHLKSAATTGDIKLNDTVVVDWAYQETVDSSDNRSGRLYNRSSHQLSGLPGEYNVIYIFSWNDDEGLAANNEVTRTIQPRVKITPRYELPGGPIA